MPFCAVPVNSGQAHGLSGLWARLSGLLSCPVPSRQALPHLLPTEGAWRCLQRDETVHSSRQTRWQEAGGSPGTTGCQSEQELSSRPPCQLPGALLPRPPPHGKGRPVLASVWAPVLIPGQIVQAQAALLGGSLHQGLG